MTNILICCLVPSFPAVVRVSYLGDELWFHVFIMIHLCTAYKYIHSVEGVPVALCSV